MNIASENSFISFLITLIIRKHIQRMYRIIFIKKIIHPFYFLINIGKYISIYRIIIMQEIVMGLLIF